MRWCGAFLALTWGCHVFDASLLTKGDADASTIDAEPDADPSYDAGTIEDATPSCTPNRPPPRGAMDGGAQSGLEEEVFFAIRAIDIDQGEAWAQTGYDIDGLCSEGETPQTECLPPVRSGEKELDGPGGIDNVFGHRVIPLFTIVYPAIEPATRLAETNGVGVFVLWLRGWNGGPDDELVDAILTQSVFGIRANEEGTEPEEYPPDGGVQYDDAGDPIVPLPRWDGRDYWWVRDDAFLAGDAERPRIRDDQAYVSNGVLVMRLPDRFPMVLTGVNMGVVFKLTDAVLTARLSADAQRLDEVLLAGRWSILDILETAPTAGVCPGTDVYTQYRRVFDLTADLRAMPNTGGPGVTCDAISVGMRFEEGVRARLGGIYPAGELPRPCDRDGSIFH